MQQAHEEMNKKQQWQAFRVDYTEQGNRHWLTLHKEGMRAADLDELDLKMLLQSKRQGMLEMRLAETNAHLMLQYDYTNRRRLGRTAQQETLSNAQIRRIMLAAISILEHASDLMLQAGKVILDPALIFIDRHSGELQFVYMPLRQPLYPQGMEGRIKQWKALLDYLERASAEDNREKFEHWRRYLRHAHFHFAGMRHMILDAEGGTAETSNARTVQAKHTQEKLLSSEERGRGAQDRNPPSTQTEATNKTPFAANNRSDAFDLPVAPPQVASSEEAAGGVDSNRLIWIGAGYVLLLIPVWRIYLAKSDLAGALWAAVGASGMLTVLAVSLLWKYRKRQVRPGEGSEIDKEINGDWMDWPLPAVSPTAHTMGRSDATEERVRTHLEAVPATQPAEDNRMWRDYVNTPEDEVDHTAAYYAGLNERTALLHQEQATVALHQATARIIEEKPVQTWIEWREPGNQTAKRCMLEEGRTLIVGRDDPEHDICLSGAQISRQHCELTQVDGQWQVMDTSSNGTMRNGEKMIPYKAYPLENQDCLRIYHYELHVVRGSLTKSQAG